MATAAGKRTRPAGLPQDAAEADAAEELQQTLGGYDTKMAALQQADAVGAMLRMTLEGADLNAGNLRNWQVAPESVRFDPGTAVDSGSSFMIINCGKEEKLQNWWLLARPTAPVDQSCMFGTSTTVPNPITDADGQVYKVKPIGPPGSGGQRSNGNAALMASLAPDLTDYIRNGLEIQPRPEQWGDYCRFIGMDIKISSEGTPIGVNVTNGQVAAAYVQDARAVNLASPASICAGRTAGREVIQGVPLMNNRDRQTGGVILRQGGNIARDLLPIQPSDSEANITWTPTTEIQLTARATVPEGHPTALLPVQSTTAGKLWLSSTTQIQSASTPFVTAAPVQSVNCGPLDVTDREIEYRLKVTVPMTARTVSAVAMLGADPPMLGLPEPQLVPPPCCVINATHFWAQLKKISPVPTDPNAEKLDVFYNTTYSSTVVRSEWLPANRNATNIADTVPAFAINPRSALNNAGALPSDRYPLDGVMPIIEGMTVAVKAKGLLTTKFVTLKVETLGDDGQEVGGVYVGTMLDFTAPYPNVTQAVTGLCFAASTWGVDNTAGQTEGYNTNNSYPYVNTPMIRWEPYVGNLQSQNAVSTTVAGGMPRMGCWAGGWMPNADLPFYLQLASAATYAIAAPNVAGLALGAMGACQVGYTFGNFNMLLTGTTTNGVANGYGYAYRTSLSGPNAYVQAAGLTNSYGGNQQYKPVNYQVPVAVWFANSIEPGSYQVDINVAGSTGTATSATAAAVATALATDPLQTAYRLSRPVYYNVPLAYSTFNGTGTGFVPSAYITSVPVAPLCGACPATGTLKQWQAAKAAGTAVAAVGYGAYGPPMSSVATWPHPASGDTNPVLINLLGLNSTYVAPGSLTLSAGVSLGPASSIVGFGWNDSTMAAGTNPLSTAQLEVWRQPASTFRSMRTGPMCGQTTMFIECSRGPGVQLYGTNITTTPAVWGSAGSNSLNTYHAGAGGNAGYMMHLPVSTPSALSIRTYLPMCPLDAARTVDYYMQPYFYDCSLCCKATEIKMGVRNASTEESYAAWVAVVSGVGDGVQTKIERETLIQVNIAARNVAVTNQEVTAIRVSQVTVDQIRSLWTMNPRLSYVMTMDEYAKQRILIDYLVREKGSELAGVLAYMAGANLLGGNTKDAVGSGAISHFIDHLHSINQRVGRAASETHDAHIQDHHRRISDVLKGRYFNPKQFKSHRTQYSGRPGQLYDGHAGWFDSILSGISSVGKDVGRFVSGGLDDVRKVAPLIQAASSLASGAAPNSSMAKGLAIASSLAGRAAPGSYSARGYGAGRSYIANGYSAGGSYAANGYACDSCGGDQ